MPSPLAEAFLMGILNGCYETPSKSDEENYIPDKIRATPNNEKYVQSFKNVKKICQSNQYICF